jgi:CxxC motif-containing protein (DUF1111 family)
VRTKSRFMHDLKSESFEQAILRHQNEASNSIRLFKQLTPQERGELLKFLSSLETKASAGQRLRTGGCPIF